jgi:hypothetical protein
MKLCKDCRWVECEGGPPTPKSLWNWICRHPTSPRPAPVDYVTGLSKEPRARVCFAMRDDPALCGPEGRYWEARDG